MNKGLLLFPICFLLVLQDIQGQAVDIKSFDIDKNGQIEVEIEASADEYYILYARHDSGSAHFPVSMTEGIDGDLKLTETLSAYPKENYIVRRFFKNDPQDFDGDGYDDLTELNNLGRLAPFNRAQEIAFRDGTTSIPDHETFSELSYQGREVIIDIHLTDLEFVKFYIFDANTSRPFLYFMNTVTHRSHGMFARGIGISNSGGGFNGVPGSMRGEIIFHPNVESPNGKLGVYRFEFEPNDSYSFEDVQRMYELLSLNMPFLENNWAYYPMPNAALPKYFVEQDLYNDSRVKILLENDIFDQIDYIPMNLAEGYGLLRIMDLDERPNSRDIVLYESLPNDLPRVGGIITTVTQTPLSHVNLRAIQDNVPNAFIRKAPDIKEIDDLVGKHIYYKVEDEQYIIREATLAEVDQFYEDLRPTENQVLPRDLSVTGIVPLDEISFDMSPAFGVKVANMATMRNFGFPEGTIRDGFGVPFYFYDEYMKHNNFYELVQEMLDTENFLTDFDIQEDLLKDLRKDIEDGEMPDWMLDELDTMHKTWPEDFSIRTRSSTNNEDLPGFSGAGLYDSKTQKPDEGHIEKSIKEVYASMWNFRAFVEREFYRIDHFDAAMGVLVHQNFKDELANGVAVSTDPINFTEGTYLINTQIGEDLVTNPDALSIPEEILLSESESGDNLIELIRLSNQVDDDGLIMTDAQYLQLRDHLKVIHEEFQVLYNAEGQDNFAMEIEYKITADNALAIKQARPWAEFWLDQAQTTSVDEVVPAQTFSLQAVPNPFSESVNLEFDLEERADVFISIFDEAGKQIGSISKPNLTATHHTISMESVFDQHENGFFFYEMTIVTDDKIRSTANKLLKF